MIGWLSGQMVDTLHPGRLVLDVNGVGYDVETSLPTFFKLEAQPGPINLHIHTVVREDALLLYGFLDKDERGLFRALIKVNGVGPKMAIAILSSITPAEFIDCINQKNTTMLTRLPGVGKKTAERLIIEMQDRLDQLPNLMKSDKNTSMSEQQEAIRALEALGYKHQDAYKVVTKIDDNNKTCEQLIRQALQLLSNK